MSLPRSETTFGFLLREHRLAAGLTQEALAERAGLGVRSIQHLERGESQPQRDTAQRLATALALTDAQRARFEALAQPSPRRRGTGAGDGAAHAAEAAPWSGSAHNLPLQLTSFIGREGGLAEVRLPASPFDPGTTVVVTSGGRTLYNGPASGGWSGPSSSVAGSSGSNEPGN